jgi:hypothetical protein
MPTISTGEDELSGAVPDPVGEGEDQVQEDGDEEG